MPKRPQIIHRFSQSYKGPLLNSLFRRQAPSGADLDSFHNDGYIFYPDVLTDAAREALSAEIHQQQD